MECWHMLHHNISGNNINDDNLLYLHLDNIINATQDVEKKATILFDFWQTNRGRHTSYIKYLVDEIIKEALICDDNHALGLCYFIQGWLILDHDTFEQNGTKEKGIALFIDAQENFGICGDELSRIRAINGEASAYRQYGYFETALERYLIGLEQAENNKDKLLINIIASNIGNLLIDLKQYEEAIKYFTKVQIAESKPTIDMVIQYSNIGKAYRCLGDYEKAEEYILKSLNICQDGNNRYAKAYAILELGFVKQCQGKTNEAKALFGECLDLSLEKRFPRVKATALLQLGIIENSMGNYAEALSFLEESLQIFQEIKARNFEVQTLLAMAEAYDGIGDFDNAYLILKRGKELEGQVFNEETISMMGILKVQQARKEGLIYKDLYNRINTISHIGQTITSTLDINEIGRVVYKHIKNLMDADNLIIGLYTDDKRELRYKINIRNGEFAPEIISKFDDSNPIEKRCITTKEGFKIDDLSKEMGVLTENPTSNLLLGNANSLICCPLIIRQDILGLISIQSYKKNAYSDHHVDILNALAAYTAIALENEKLFSYVKELAITDHLTTLPNRRNIFEQAQKEFYRNKRYDKPLSVLMADIDRFKSINDTYGHAAGDIVLKKIAEVFLSIVRGTDMLGRIGGEEFLFVLPNTNIEEAAFLANRLCHAISNKEYDLLKNKVHITVSIGVAEVATEDDSISDTIKRADSALYAVKETGGNRIQKGI